MSIKRALVIDSLHIWNKKINKIFLFLFIKKPEKVDQLFGSLPQEKSEDQDEATLVYEKMVIRSLAQ